MCAYIASCLELLDLFTRNTLYELLIIKVYYICTKVSSVQQIGRNPFLWIVLCKISNLLTSRALQHAFIMFFQRFPIPHSIPYSSPFCIPPFTVSHSFPTSSQFYNFVWEDWPCGQWPGHVSSQAICLWNTWLPVQYIYIYINHDMNNSLWS